MPLETKEKATLYTAKLVAQRKLENVRLALMQATHTHLMKEPLPKKVIERYHREKEETEQRGLSSFQDGPVNVIALLDRTAEGMRVRYDDNSAEVAIAVDIHDPKQAYAILTWGRQSTPVSHLSGQLNPDEYIASRKLRLAKHKNGTFRIDGSRPANALTQDQIRMVNDGKKIELSEWEVLQDNVETLSLPHHLSTFISESADMGFCEPTFDMGSDYREQYKYAPRSVRLADDILGRYELS